MKRLYLKDIKSVLRSWKYYNIKEKRAFKIAFLKDIIKLNIFNGILY